MDTITNLLVIIGSFLLVSGYLIMQIAIALLPIVIIYELLF